MPVNRVTTTCRFTNTQLRCIFAAALVMIICSHESRGEGKEGESIRNNCGPIAVAVVAKQLRTGRSYDDVRQCLRTKEEGAEYTLEELLDSCECLGIQAVGVQVDSSQLPSVPAVLPVAVGDGRLHFIVAVDTRDHMAQVVDYPRDAVWVDLESLRKEKRWNGELLLCGDSRVSLASRYRVELLGALSGSLLALGVSRFASRQ